MKKIWFILFCLLIANSVRADSYLYQWDTGSGTTWPGWTWFADGADDYGNPGWRYDLGEFIMAKK
jgi:hypothetical protein